MTFLSFMFFILKSLLQVSATSSSCHMHEEMPLFRTKYQKNVEASHNKGIGMKANSVPSCIRSENYIITFEVEEEKYTTSHTSYKVVSVFFTPSNNAILDANDFQVPFLWEKVSDQIC